MGIRHKIRKLIKYETNTESKNDENMEAVTKKKVIFFLDEVGLAEQSENRPLKILHKLLENPKIPFVGLSNWRLDSAKMNRCILHNVLLPTQKDLVDTAKEIIGIGDDEKTEGDQNYNTLNQNEISGKLGKIADIYKQIVSGNPLNFGFHGHRDFYSLVSYLKSKLAQTNTKWMICC